MAQGSCRASTVLIVTVLSFLTGGLILCIGVLHWEYTEEIERLKRDLVATREKSGVFLAYENYQELVVSKETVEKELSEKLGRIKAMEEEREKMEGIFENLKQRISKYERDLKHSCLQRDEQVHLVAKHSATEKKLSHQAKEILTAADESVIDLTKLHSKLDRRRSVDEENDGKIPQFVESYHREVDRMGEEVVRGIQDQLKSCVAQSSVYGQLLDKRILELNAHRDLLDSIVIGVTSYIESQKNTATQQTKSAQEWVTGFRTTSRGHFASQSAQQNAAFVENFIPATLSVVRLISECASDISHLQKNFKTEADRYNEMVATFVTEQRDLIERTRTGVTHFVGEEKMILDRMGERAKLREQEQLQQITDFDKEIDAGIHLLNNLKKKSTLLRERASNATEELEGFTASADQELNRFGTSTNALLADTGSRVKDFGVKVTNMKKETYEMSIGVMDKVSTQQRRAVEVAAQQELDMKSHVSTHETNWNAIQEAQENELRKLADEQANVYRNYLSISQDQSNLLFSSRQQHEILIEEQSSDFSAFVRERQEELDGRCTSMNDLTQFVNSGMRSRKEEVEKFLTEDLRKDIPTGQTPQRRDFTYPRALAQTSPHDRILERFRQNLEDVSEDSNSSAVSESPMSSPILNRKHGSSDPKSNSLTDLSSQPSAEQRPPTVTVRSQTSLGISELTRSGSSHSLEDEGKNESQNKENFFQVPQAPKAKKRELKAPQTGFMRPKEKRGVLGSHSKRDNYLNNTE